MYAYDIPFTVELSFGSNLDPLKTYQNLPRFLKVKVYKIFIENSERHANRCNVVFNIMNDVFQSCVCSMPVRWLNMQEYQSKKLMEDNGINVQKFRMAEDISHAKAIAESFSVREYVIKAQILAGGRGKGVFSNGFKGGVHLTKK